MFNVDIFDKVATAKLWQNHISIVVIIIFSDQRTTPYGVSSTPVFDFGQYQPLVLLKTVSHCCSWFSDSPSWQGCTSWERTVRSRLTRRFTWRRPAATTTIPSFIPSLSGRMRTRMVSSCTVSFVPLCLQL